MLEPTDAGESSDVGLRSAPDAGSSASAFVGPPGALRDYFRPAPARIWRDALATWAVILVALGAAAITPVVVWPALFVVISARQLALSHLVHDAAHYNISRNKSRNDLISDVFFAAPTLISTGTYRAIHRLHHAHLGEARQDSDVRAWYTLRGWRAVRRVALTLLGLEAAKTLASYSERMQGQTSTERLRQLALVAVTNLVLLGYCAALGVPIAYFVLWLLPVFTLTVLLLTLRVIAEHQREEYAMLATDAFGTDMVPPLVRTIEAGPIERFLLGPMNFCYHHEHHLFPAIPYARLPQLHDLLVERGYYDDREEELAPSYRSVLRSLVRPHRRLPKPAEPSL